MNQSTGSRLIGLVAFLLIVALYVVGIVSHGILRHIVQTLPVWPTVILGLRGSPWSKWTGLPSFFLWLILMVNIWLLLAGLPHVLSGTFSPTEIAMTIVVGASSLVGIVTGIRMKSGKRVLTAIALFFLLLLLQLLALRISFLPGISHD